MEVYLVRHGETNGNVARRHQHPETSINDLGKEQVRATALKLAKLPITHFITSTQLRAVESARIISEELGLIPDTNPAFQELERPLTLVGHRYIGLVTLWYVLRWFLGISVPQGESYADFLVRVRTARSYLETLPSNARVVVVSHAVFINIFLEHLCLDRRMSFFQAISSFRKIFKLRNASVIHLHFAKHPGICGWTILKR